MWGSLLSSTIVLHVVYEKSLILPFQIILWAIVYDIFLCDFSLPYLMHELFMMQFLLGISISETFEVQRAFLKDCKTWQITTLQLDMLAVCAWFKKICLTG